MSSIVTTFNPATSTETQFTAPQSAANGALVFFNESNNNLVLSFANGDTMYLPAWYHRHKCGASGSVTIDWDIHQTLSSFSPPVSEVIVEAFRAGEPFPADGPLVRQTNTGNSVPLSTSATSIANDGNLANTNIVEATVSGDPASAVKITNDGQVSIGSNLHPGLVSLDNGLITTDGIGHIVMTNGKALRWKDGSGTAQPAVLGTSTNDLRLTNLNAGATVQIYDANATEIAEFDTTNGLALLVGKLHLPNDGTQHQSGISFFGPVTVAGAAFYNHNLGTTPDVIMLSIGELHASTLTVTWDKATMTATQVKLQANGTINNVYGIAFKF